MVDETHDSVGMENVAVLGAGVIGASWASLFLAAGLKVQVYDAQKGIEKSVRDYIDKAWPTLETLGLADQGNKDNVVFHSSATKAVECADFVQENVPERIQIKHQLYSDIESALQPNAIVATSASGLMLRELQSGWQDPAQFILGHPFNPPHLIPLVEVLANDRTHKGVIDRARAFYERIGKVTIEVKREVPAHVANRLQAALWKEAIHLVESGVASVEDVDKAVWAGPGLRWAAMGPHMLFHLGAGGGGIEEFCTRYKDSFHRWWDDLGHVELTPQVIQQLATGIEHQSDGNNQKALSSRRDALIAEYLKGRSHLEDTDLT